MTHPLGSYDPTSIPKTRDSFKTRVVQRKGPQTIASDRYSSFRLKFFNVRLHGSRNQCASHCVGNVVVSTGRVVDTDQCPLWVTR